MLTWMPATFQSAWQIDSGVRRAVANGTFCPDCLPLAVGLTKLGYAWYAERFMPSLVVASIMNVSARCPLTAGAILSLQEPRPCKRNSWVTIWIF